MMMMMMMRLDLISPDLAGRDVKSGCLLDCMDSLKNHTLHLSVSQGDGHEARGMVMNNQCMLCMRIAVLPIHFMYIRHIPCSSGKVDDTRIDRAASLALQALPCMLIDLVKTSQVFQQFCTS